MPFFKYIAYDQQGGKIQGEIEAIDKDTALLSLQNEKLFVSTVEQKVNIDVFSLKFGKKSLSLKQLEYLTSELSLLLKNGVKIDKGLSIINQNNESGPTNLLVSKMLSSVRRGESLSQSMSEQENVFNKLYINLVKLGEASGDLSTVFERLSKDLRFQSELRDKIIQALTYPLIIFMVCVICIAFVFNYIVPQMSSLFEGMTTLPMYTVALLLVSDWFIKYQWFILIISFLMMFSGYTFRQHPLMSRLISNISMKLPLIKSMSLLAEQIRFNSALSMMSQAGVSLDKSMLLAADAIKNVQLRKDMLAAHQKIRKGDKLSSALSKSPLYPSFSVSLLEVGEES
ncbi:MAG: type II secretion system F family protein, partial [Hellea sp.]